MQYMHTLIARMTTFIKTKFKISDDKTNIDKYRLAKNITEYHIISKLILQRIIITRFASQDKELELQITMYRAAALINYLYSKYIY